MRSSATSCKRRRSWVIGVALAVSWCISGVNAHTLRLRVQPGRALGGEPFGEQPQVEILEGDGDGGNVDALFQVSSYTAAVILLLFLLGSIPF